MPRVCGVHTLDWGPAVNTCVMEGASCRHIHNGGDQGRKQELEQTVDIQVATGALVVSVYYCV